MPHLRDSMKIYSVLGLSHGTNRQWLNTADDIIMCTLRQILSSMGLYRRKNKSNPLVETSFVSDELKGHGRIYWLSSGTILTASEQGFLHRRVLQLHHRIKKTKKKKNRSASSYNVNLKDIPRLDAVEMDILFLYSNFSHYQSINVLIKSISKLCWDIARLCNHSSSSSSYYYY